MSDSRDIPSVPVTTLAGLTSLSDLLSELPISDSVPFHSNLHKSLLFHPRVQEEATNLLANRNENLAQDLIDALQQSSVPNIELKPEFARLEDTTKVEAPPLLQLIQTAKPNVFNAINNQKIVNPIASQYHAQPQPQENYSLSYESFNQLNFTTSNIIPDSNQFGQQQQQHDMLSSSTHNNHQNNYSMQQYHQQQQQLISSPNIINQDPFQQPIANQFVGNSNQSLDAVVSPYQQQQQVMNDLLGASTSSGSHLQQNLYTNQQVQMNNTELLGFSQNMVGYYEMNVQQQQEPTYNCVTVDQTQIQQQKLDSTHYNNQIMQQTIQKVNHSASSASGVIVNATATSSSSSSSSSILSSSGLQHNQQLPNTSFNQQLQQSTSAATPPVNNMHLRNNNFNNNNCDKTQQQATIPQQKVAPRNNEYLEQQQQQRPSPAQGTIAPDANHMSPNLNNDGKILDPNSISIHPTTSGDALKLDVNSMFNPLATTTPTTSSSIPSSDVPLSLLTTFDLPEYGAIESMQNLNLKKIVINVPKIKVTPEEQKKMFEIRSESIQSESTDNCVDDTFNQMKADEVRTPIKRKIPPENDVDRELFSKPKLRRVEKVIAPVTKKLSTEELMKTNTYIRFNNFMDKIFDQLDDTEGPLSMEENDDAMECIPTAFLSNVSIEAAKLKARSAIDAIPEEKLTLLISYAMRSIHAAKNISAGPDLPDTEIADDNLERILNAIEASLLICNIYTSKDTKFLQEDNIDAIIKFVQFQLRETIFPSFDPVYTIETKKKVDSKKKKAPTYQQKGISQLYAKIVELSKLFVRLFIKFHFVDTIIIHASALGVEPFFVDNIETLQFVCLDLVTSIFQNEKYKHHRYNILNDILSSVDRLPHSKRNLRPYKLTNNGGNIQMMTALVLQLIQCAVILPEELSDDYNKRKKSSANSDETFKSKTDKDLFITEKYDTAISIGGHFLQTFLTKCKTRNMETDFRPLFENFIHDLLTTVNKPEWPASELLLRLLGRLLVTYMSDKSMEQSIRVVSLEYLGIVAARLRKDTVESRCKVNTMDELIKCIKLEQEKEGDDEEESMLEIDPEEERTEFLQRILLDYLTLNSQEENPVWNHARHFYMTQWYRDIMNRKKRITEGEKGFASRKKSKNKRSKHYHSDDSDSRDGNETREVDQELNLEVFRILEDRKKYLLNKITPFKRNSKNVIDLKTYLDYDNANLIAQYLASKREFSQSFEIYLKKIILVVKEPVVAIRTRAMKCLGNIVEVDQSLLTWKDMRIGVEQKLLDAAISVREAAVDLVGKYILSDKELVDQYYDMIAFRILDTGVSVRKRVIKILRDICHEFPAHPKIPDICVKMLRRINDEEAIQKLVMDVFMTMWFTPCPDHDKAAIARKVEQIIDVELSSQETGFNGLLKTVFEPKESKEDSKVMKEIPQTLIRSCKQIIAELVESIMIFERSDTKRLVGCVQALNSFASIQPKLLVEHTIKLEPYLNIHFSQNDALRKNFLCLLAEILEKVVPLMEHPGEVFLSQLENDLMVKIIQSPRGIVASFTACLGAVVNKITKNYNLVRACFMKFYRTLSFVRSKLVENSASIEQFSSPTFKRALYSVGILMRHFNFSLPEVYGLNTPDALSSTVCQDVFETLFIFIRCNSNTLHDDILSALGFFCVTNDEYLTKDELKNYYNELLRNARSRELKITVLKNIFYYLVDQEQKMARNDENWVAQSKNEDLKEMGDLSSGMSSRVIQIYLKEILNCFLNESCNVRSVAMNVIDIVLRQGLVHPVQIVPYLICLSTDSEPDVSQKAAKHLQDIDKQYQGFVNMKVHAGISLSYELQRTLQKNGEIVRGYQNSKNKEEPPQARNGFLYTLLRNTKPTRRALIQSITKQFDDERTTLSFMLYLADNLAYFPYVVQDEPLYIINQINLVTSNTATNLLQSFRDSFKPKPGVEKEGPANPLEDEDDDDDREMILERLPDDTTDIQTYIKAAQGFMLLLILKQHLKEMYGINDGKISRYSPSESTKIYDKAMQRKNTPVFDPKATISILSEPDKSGRQLTDNEKRVLVDRYLEFKQLMNKLDQDEQDSDAEVKTTTPRVSSVNNSMMEANSSSMTNDFNNSTNHVQNSNQVNNLNANLSIQQPQVVPTTNFEKSISVNAINRSANKSSSKSLKTAPKRPSTSKKKKRRKLSSSEEESDYDDDDYD